MAIADYVDIEFQRRIIKHAGCAIVAAVGFGATGYVIKVFSDEGWKVYIEAIENFCLIVVFIGLAIDLLLGIVQGIWQNIKGFLNAINSVLAA